MISPPCRLGSNRASFCLRVSLGSPAGTTRTVESWADTSTGCPTLNPADLAIEAGIRTARLLPHRCSVRVAVFSKREPPCINQYKHSAMSTHSKTGPHEHLARGIGFQLAVGVHDLVQREAPGDFAADRGVL